MNAADPDWDAGTEARYERHRILIDRDPGDETVEATVDVDDDPDAWKDTPDDA